VLAGKKTKKEIRKGAKKDAWIEANQCRIEHTRGATEVQATGVYHGDIEYNNTYKCGILI
jgi:hypothetical protein